MEGRIEGRGVAAFQAIRAKAGNALAGAVNAYVMQDEARHVSFGRLALRDYYPKLSEAERDEREEFAVEALHFMRDRFNQSEVWERLTPPAQMPGASHYKLKQKKLFRRPPLPPPLPASKDTRVWGPRPPPADARQGEG